MIINIIRSITIKNKECLQLNKKFHGTIHQIKYNQFQYIKNMTNKIFDEEFDFIKTQSSFDIWKGKTVLFTILKNKQISSNRKITLIHFIYYKYDMSTLCDENKRSIFETIARYCDSEMIISFGFLYGWKSFYTNTNSYGMTPYCWLCKNKPSSKKCLFLTKRFHLENIVFYPDNNGKFPSDYINEYIFRIKSHSKSIYDERYDPYLPQLYKFNYIDKK